MLYEDIADSYFLFYMVIELNDIGKLKMKVLKMMLESIDIQNRKTCFYRKENEFISSTDAIYFHCEQISKITREVFKITHYEHFISVDERKNRSSKKADSGDFTPIKFIVERRRDIQNRKFFFLFISSSILSRWNLCSKIGVKINCLDLVTLITLKYIITDFEDCENLWKDHIRFIILDLKWSRKTETLKVLHVFLENRNLSYEDHIPNFFFTWRG